MRAELAESDDLCWCLTSAKAGRVYAMSAMVDGTGESTTEPRPQADKVASVQSARVSGTLSPTRWAGLGGLRFFLAFAVLATHLHDYFDPRGYFGGAAVDALSGYAAVIGFFVVSGYSINASLDREADGFARRRFVRIYPTYVAATMLGLLVYGLHASLPQTTWQAPHVDTFTPLIANAHLRTLATLLMGTLCLPYVFTYPMPAMHVTWSLTCEVLYYGMAKWLKRLGSNRVLLLIGASIVLYICHNIFLRHQHYSMSYYLIAPVCLFWAWGVGFVYYQSPRTWLSRAVMVLGVIALTMLPDLERTSYMIFTCVVAAAGVVVAERVYIQPRVAAALTYLGEISYAMYLVHNPVYLLVYHFTYKHHPMPPAVYVACAIGVSCVVYHLVDLPARRFAARKYHTVLAHGIAK